MAFLPTNATSVQAFAGALYGLQIGTGTMTQVNNDITSFGGLNNALNAYYSASFGSTATATVAANLVANIGISAANSAAAVSYVTGVLNATAASARGAAVMNILNQLASLSSDATFGADATAWNTKVATAVAYTGAADAASGSVVNQTFTLTTGVDNVVGGAGADTITADNTATSKQLTVADAVNGGAGTDTLKVFNATGDAIDGLATILASSVSNVENVYLNNGALTNTKTLDISTATGITSLTVDSPAAMADSDAFTFKVASTQSLALTKLAGTTGGATSTVNLNGVTNLTLNNVGTDVTLDLTSTGTALKVTSTGSTASAVALANTGAKLVTLTLAGDTKAATYTVNAATSGQLTTIDATGAAAGAKVTLTTNAVNTLAFTGSAGNDTLTVANGALVKTQVLDGGAGTDTLATDVGAVSSSTTTFNAAVNAAKNFEVLGLTMSTAAGAGATASTLAVDASQITSIATFDVVNGINNSTQSTAGAGVDGVAYTGTGNSQTFQFDGAMVGQVAKATGGTASGAGASFAPLVDTGSNVLNLTLNGVSITGGAAGSGAAGVGVSASSYETVNIVSNNNAAASATSNSFAVGSPTGGTAAAGAIVVGTNATVNISGALKMDTGAISGTNVTVNAANLTGALVTATGSGNDSIIGGSGTNTITLNGGVDTVDLSKSAAKADVVTIASASGLDATASKFVAITGFTNALSTSVGDKLDVLNTGTVVADASNVATGITNLTASITKGIVTFGGSAAATATLANLVSAVFSTNVLGTTQYNEVAFQYNGDTYVAQQGDTTAAYAAGTDLVVKLVGLTGATALSATASDATTIWAV